MLPVLVALLSFTVIFASTSRALDNSRPTVVFTNPSAGASCVGRSTVIRVGFSEALDPRTVNGSTFLVKGITGKVSYDPARNAAIFTPSTALEGDKIFTLRITTGVRDLAGQRLEAPFFSVFTTGPCPPGATIFLYTANEADGDISGFKINADTGALAPIPGSPFASGVGPTALASDSAGKFLFAVMSEQIPGVQGSNCANFPGQLFVYGIDSAEGRLTILDQKTLAGVCASDAELDPSGKFVYVTMSDQVGAGGLIQAFSVAESGALTEIPGSPFVSSQIGQHLAMHRSGKFLYASDGQVLIFDRDVATGALSFKGLESTGLAFDLRLNPAGDFLVSTPSFGASNDFSVFRVDPRTGLLSAAASALDVNPVAVDIDPSGKYVAVADLGSLMENSGGVSVYKMNQITGSLEKVPGSPFLAGALPLAAQFDPQDRFLYTANFKGATVSAFRFVRDTGVLIPLPGVPTGAFPSDLRIVAPRSRR